MASLLSDSERLSEKPNLNQDLVQEKIIQLESKKLQRVSEVYLFQVITNLTIQYMYMQEISNMIQHMLRMVIIKGTSMSIYYLLSQVILKVLNVHSHQVIYKGKLSKDIAITSHQ